MKIHRSRRVHRNDLNVLTTPALCRGMKGQNGRLGQGQVRWGQGCPSSTPRFVPSIYTFSLNEERSKSAI